MSIWFKNVLKKPDLAQIHACMYVCMYTQDAVRISQGMKSTFVAVLLDAVWSQMHFSLKHVNPVTAK